MSIQQFVEKCKSECFNEGQIHEICLGFYFGLSIEKVSLFAKKEFNDDQMREIRHMLIHKDDIELIKTKVALMILES